MHSLSYSPEDDTVAFGARRFSLEILRQPLGSPFSLEETSSGVIGVRSEKPKVLERARVRVDLLARRAFLEGKEVYLRPREYSLLVLFLSNAGRALSYAAIGSLWPFQPTADNVHAHIKNLRARLPGLPLETLQGIGYRLS